MDYAHGMSNIIVEHAGEKVRYIVRGEPDTGDRDLLHLRDDVTWGDDHQRIVDHELEQLTAKEVYADLMGEGEVTQSIKVADDSVLFTGYIEDDVVIVQFERGILSYLPDIVADFHVYMVEHDVDFTSLSMPSNR